MRKPLLQSYGLVPEDIPSITQAQRRLDSTVSILAGIVGALGGLVVFLVIGAVSEEMGAAVFGLIVGWSVTASVTQPWLRELVTRLDARLGRYAKYTAALAQYEAAADQIELERRRKRVEYWRSLSGRAFEQEMARAADHGHVVLRGRYRIWTWGWRGRFQLIRVDTDDPHRHQGDTD